MEIISVRDDLNQTMMMEILNLKGEINEIKENNLSAYNIRKLQILDLELSLKIKQFTLINSSLKQ